MLRVLLLITDLQRGGTPLRLLRTAQALRNTGIEPIVAALAGGGPLTPSFRQAGIPTFHAEASGPRDVSCLFRLRRLVVETDPDLVHSTLFHANIAARLVGRSGRNRPIVTASATIEVERRWHRLCETLTSRWSDWHVANSRAVARHLVTELGFPPERVVVIPNPVDIAGIEAVPAADRRAMNIPSDVPLVAWAGRMDPVKRIDLLLEALARLRPRRRFAAVLFGDGPERQRIESLVAELGLTDAVRLPGWRNDLAAWLKAADLLVLPSHTEGSPNVVLEAMAAGCCVLAADIPACRELIEPGRTGALFSGYNADSIASLIIDLLASPDRRRSLAAAARTVVSRGHRPETIAFQLSGLYHHAVKNLA